MSLNSRCRIGDLELDSGVILRDAEVAYTTYGCVNDDLSNIVVAFHALTGDANVGDWWSGIVGDGRPIDPKECFIICFNSIGSCYGSTGPESIDPDTGVKYGRTFPKITTRDIARSQIRALQVLGIEHAALGIGGSMGAMVLLEAALCSPGFFDALIPIACGASHTAWRIAFSSVIRNIIEETAEAYGNSEEGFIRGMKLARKVGMTSYRSYGEFEKRFARQKRDGAFETEHYLRHQAEKIAARFSPHSYLRLTEAMESYDIRSAVGSIDTPALVVGIDSDMLYPEQELRTLAEELPLGSYQTLHAEFGHDSFLVVQDALAAIVSPFINEHSTISLCERIFS